MGRITADILIRLLDEHGAGLVLYARQWCNAPEDVVQEAVLQLMRQSAVPENVTGWMYRVVRNLALNASRMYSNWLGIEADQWTAEAYISFVCKFMLGMGLGFEMPVFLLVLVKIGVLDYQKLAGFRRYMIVVNLVLGAVLTTPEVLTQVMMAVPLQILYEVTVWIAWYWERRDKKRLAQEGQIGS